MPGTLKQLHRDRIGAQAKAALATGIPATFHIVNDHDNQPRILAGKTVIVGWCDYWPGALQDVKAEYSRAFEELSRLAAYSKAAEQALARLELAKAAGGAQ